MKTTAHDRAWKHFVEIGEIPADAKKRTWHLHHINPILKYFDPDRYALWLIEDLQPMTSSDHAKLHRYLQTSGIFDQLYAEAYEKLET